MNAVAEKYHSMLDIFISDENVFTVQTALRIPKIIKSAGVIHLKMTPADFIDLYIV